MTKVCHMTSAHGAEDVRIFHKECVSLARAGYDVYLVQRGESYEKNGVHIVGVGEIPASRRKRMTRGARTVYEAALALDADIYHFHDPELLPYGLKLKKKGKKVIFDSHENTAEQIKEKTWIPNVVRRPLYSGFDRYQKGICRRLDAVISVTPHICDSFRGVAPRVAMVTNYPALKPLPQPETVYPRSLCFAGGIEEQWCHREIICALSAIEDCTYILCGKGDSGYLSSLTAMPEWGRVDFLGQVPHEQVHSLLGGCTIGMSILRYSHNTAWKLGTMGNNKIFEEMMAGLPVICTDFTLWREFVERYHCGICVDPSDTNAITAAIRYLLDNPGEAGQMGENGRRAVEKEFNWGVEEKKLLALYEDIAKE